MDEDTGWGGNREDDRVSERRVWMKRIVREGSTTFEAPGRKIYPD